MRDLVRHFDVSGISKSPAIFDIEKLKWMNGEYIRRLAPDEFHRLAMQYYDESLKNTGIDLEKVSNLLQIRTEVLSDIKPNTDFFVSLPDYDAEIYVHKKMKTTLENSLQNLKAVLSVIESITKWKSENIHDEIINLVQKLGIKNGQMLWPVRTALSGKSVTPGGAIELADILGKEETIRRIETGIQRLSQINQ
jgi:glutamyl-tRNA synthetase